MVTREEQALGDAIDCGQHCAGLRDREGLVEEAVTTLLTTLDVTEVVERAGRLLRKHFGGTRLAINRWDEARPEEAEILRVDDPRHPAPEPGTRVVLEGSACGEAIRRREPVTVEQLQPEGGRYREEAELARYGYGAMACFPLLADDRVLGTLQIAHVPPEGILCQCFQPADRVARLIGIALHNSEMVAEIKRLNQLLHRENARLKNEVQQIRRRWRYVAESPAMAAVLEQVRLVAPSETTVLVRGETGTGKEGIARMVHEASDRAAGPFVAVNLGALPESLIESELFGHEKGAFTGAHRRKIGRFEQASGGTLFLDEVGDAPAAVQVKLLRALQEKEILRVGGTEPVSVDVRVVAATNRPLETLVEQGIFRQDLYYRLNIFPIQLPPLRDRLEDLRPLAEHLLERLATQLHRPVPRVPEAAWAALRGYSWPGNVRELENTLERALILSPEDELLLPAGAGPAHEVPGPAGAPTRGVAEVPLDREQGHAAPGEASSKETGSDAEAQIPTFDEAVAELLSRALEASGGRIYGEQGAAELLSLKPTTLQGKLKKYGLR